MSSSRFLPCVVILTTAVIVLAVIDNNRPWKRLQSDLLETERQTLASELDTLRNTQRDLLDQLQTEIRAENDKLRDRRDEIHELESDLRLFRGKTRAAEQRQRRLRAKLEAAIERDAAAELQELLRQTRMEIEGLGEFITARESSLDTIRSELTAARGSWAAAKAPIDTLEQRLAELEEGPLATVTRLVSPSASIRQITIPEATAAGAATTSTVPTVDRCVSCHVGAIREGFEDESWPSLLLAHPRPELFVASTSPHPYTRFGCSSCHGGEGRSTDFTRAGHSPTSDAQAESWATTWNWRRPASQPLSSQRRSMLPLDLTAAACGSCHRDAQATDGMPELARGHRLIAELGCNGCHAGEPEGLENPRRIGPPLHHIAEKIRPDWAIRWLDPPPELRSGSHRPHVLGQDSPGADPDRRTAEARAVVSILWDGSRQDAYPAPPDGDIKNGRGLFDRIGCAACHVVDPGQERAETPYGPLLAGIGSKVSPGWLFTWLLDPRSLHPETTMPSLRLNRQEAADLTAFLLDHRDPAWERQQLPTVDPTVRDGLLLELLEQEMTLEASQAKLDGMSERQRHHALGERTIRRRGCYGCHLIPGFEDATAVAPRLSELAADLPPQRWLPASHQPSYELDDDQTTALSLAILSLGLPPLDALLPANEPQATVLTAGRRILESYRCQACHLLEPVTDPSKSQVDRRQAPGLTHIGARLSSPWLFSYLADPTRFNLRPWLKTRMPTFGLSVEERNMLVRYFAARDGRPLLADDGALPGGLSADDFEPVDLAVGAVVFRMLQCDSCHSNKSPEVQQAPELAPRYQLARQRLRPDWVVDWILDPHAWSPETAMPANFLADSTSQADSSFLIGSINTPIFAVERQRLRRLFDSEADLHAYLSDSHRVASALRDYIWTLGE